MKNIGTINKIIVAVIVFSIVVILSSYLGNTLQGVIDANESSEFVSIDAPLNVPSTELESEISTPVQSGSGTLQQTWSFIKSLLGELSEEILASLVIYLFAQRRSHKKKLEGLEEGKDSSITSSHINLHIDTSVVAFAAVVILGIGAIVVPIYYMSTHPVTDSHLEESITPKIVEEPEPSVSIEEPIAETGPDVGESSLLISNEMDEIFSLAGTLFLCIISLVAILMLMQLSAY
jgi:hypothetical protein